MSLEQAITDCRKAQNELNASLQVLLAAVNGVEDDQRAGPVEPRARAIDEIIGWNQESAAAITRAASLAAPPSDLPGVLRELTQAQQAFDRLSHEFLVELMSYPAIQEFHDFAAAKANPAWKDWVNGVIALLHRCEHAVHAVNQPTLACWREFGNAAITNSAHARTVEVRRGPGACRQSRTSGRQTR